MCQKLIALGFGIICQSAFILAVVMMAIGLHGGMNFGVFALHGMGSVIWDLSLVLLFPIGHSVLLGRFGRRVLSRIVPGDLGRHLVTTTFVIVASVQLVVLFLLWSHLGSLEWRPEGFVLAVWNLFYALSWLFLGVAMCQAGLGTQMGLLGWTSVLKGKDPSYPTMPRGGLYSVCRHPVYFAMALVSISGPVWNLDHAIIGSVFLLYSTTGPIFKERRSVRMFGEAFEAYRLRVPFFPTPRSIISRLVQRT